MYDSGGDPLRTLGMDRLSKEQRSQNMSVIRDKDTKPELFVRRFLRTRRVSYRCNVRTLPGRPDIAIKKYKLALNVHGCFWHGHNNCKRYRLPKSNVDFWKAKIESNILRDERQKQTLLSLGYHYWEIWECEILRGDLTKLEEFVDVYRRVRNIVQF